MDDPAVFARWYEALVWMHEIAPRLPKVHRPTLVRRFLDHGLSLIRVITDLRYTRRRGALFAEADGHLDQLRVLARLLCDLRALSVRQYERFSKSVDEVGRMIGGWRKTACGASGG
jgi:hypothetical protein